MRLFSVPSHLSVNAPSAGSAQLHQRPDQRPRNGPRLGGGKGSGDLQGLRGDQEQGVAQQGGGSGAFKVGAGRLGGTQAGWKQHAAPARAWTPAATLTGFRPLLSSETKYVPVSYFRPRGVQVCTPKQDRRLPRAVLRQRATDRPSPERASAKGRPCAHPGTRWPAPSQVRCSGV